MVVFTSGIKVLFLVFKQRSSGYTFLVKGPSFFIRVILHLLRLSLLLVTFFMYSENMKDSIGDFTNKFFVLILFLLITYLSLNVSLLKTNRVFYSFHPFYVYPAYLIFIFLLGKFGFIQFDIFHIRLHFDVNFTFLIDFSKRNF